MKINSARNSQAGLNDNTVRLTKAPYCMTNGHSNLSTNIQTQNQGLELDKEQVDHKSESDMIQKDKSWPCDVCKKTFTTKYFLKKHTRLHTGEMPYCCELCGRTFTFQQSYHKHMLYHSNQRPHKCNYCQRSFRELSTLHNHLRIHTGEKPFTCDTCGKSFRQRVSYLVHRRIHTGVLPYTCEKCHRNFRYKVSLRTHKCGSAYRGSRETKFVSKLLESYEKHQTETTETTKKSEEDNIVKKDTFHGINTNQENTYVMHPQADSWTLPIYTPGLTPSASYCPVKLYTTIFDNFEIETLVEGLNQLS